MILKVLDKLMGIRVSPEVEDKGLDMTEHGELAYEALHKKFDDGLGGSQEPINRERASDREVVDLL